MTPVDPTNPFSFTAFLVATKRFYRLLLDLRTHLTEGIERHSEETLKRSAKDDAGDLSAYGQHMADAGTDTFDRDFALSMVASEQEALSEIDAAIKRIHDGTYGVKKEYAAVSRKIARPVALPRAREGRRAVHHAIQAIELVRHLVHRHASAAARLGQVAPHVGPRQHQRPGVPALPDEFVVPLVQDPGRVHVASVDPERLGIDQQLRPAGESRRAELEQRQAAQGRQAGAVGVVEREHEHVRGGAAGEREGGVERHLGTQPAQSLANLASK